MDWKNSIHYPARCFCTREKNKKKTEIITPIACVAWHDKKQYVMYLPQRSGDAGRAVQELKKGTYPAGAQL